MYRRFQDSSNGNGFFHSYMFDRIEEMLTDKEQEEYAKMYSTLRGTNYISEIGDKRAIHFFTEEFWNAHPILERIKEIMPTIEDLEYIEVRDKDIIKTWFEDEQQLILEVNNDRFREEHTEIRTSEESDNNPKLREAIEYFEKLYSSMGISNSLSPIPKRMCEPPIWRANEYTDVSKFNL